MNTVIEIGRLTRDPEVRYGGANNTAVARFSIAVPRRRTKEGADETDFFNCVAFGKTGEFIEKYFHKGNKIVINGHLQSGSYTNKEGQKVYTVDIICDDVEFGESKSSSDSSISAEKSAPAEKKSSTNSGKKAQPTPEDFDLSDLDGLDEELPFN